ncbi:type II toxin-antitoxin system PemK/MazF family toxin [Lactobacillus acidophilus]|uniref:type II toxin-antitoxin system PemK/MazF family toxin n=1 Tax=Lactobacillus acidophilus TaxID=1579 RepID=UPI0021A3C1A7|nr:type II toxin-antitoxin system PemK/MazF family toxin [Lactobacillus acidophilus]MCT3602300.1 type II toxin-antitoxin system PemK/MazF family toxin [Lactobacillus acidophilus]MCT3624543.1 type II toxin-antitoxin system PemK/MazF family toxin [Lactobacillus acidophilus]
MARRFHQGDLIKMNFNPTRGHAQRGFRPALVVSNDDFNELCGGLIKVVAITSEIKEFPLNMKLPDGLPVHGQVLLSQEQTIDSSSVAHECTKVGSVPKAFLEEALEKITLTYKYKRLLLFE